MAEEKGCAVSASELMDRVLTGRDPGVDDAAGLLSRWTDTTLEVRGVLARLARQMGGEQEGYLGSLIVEAYRPLDELAERLSYLSQRLNSDR
ncbi:hypothetical protein GCM10022220_02800 [Actinocatenispora rupis]|uniref:hypothetical protein n=1 Tax=Actinocatenispora rupis TaxID=519421 RepID=UPI0031ED492E